MGKLFGTDGIRGVANEHPMTAEMAMNIGRATAHLFKKRGHVPKIIIGKDTRISGYMLENALVSGICSMGVHAIMVGVLPTPGIAFLTGSMRADAGIVISASHNPFQDNGIKIFGSEGFKLPDETETAIEEIVFANNLHTLHPSPSELGKAYRMEDARGRYIVFLKHAFPKECSLEGTRIVLDCSNGATYRVAPETFMELGAEVTTLFDEPNGKNINLQCGSQHPEVLAKEVRKAKADVGFAFDGDGDRMIAVDETGAVMTGDRMLAICAASLKKQGLLTNNLVVRTVMSNIGLGLAFESLGIDSVMTGVGDGAMKKEGKPLSELAKIMKVFPQMLINVNVKSRPEIETVPEIMTAIRDTEKQLGSQGRVLVRYSGTQNMCRVMVEGPTPEETERRCREIAEVVDKTLNA
ncbi:MAG: phosphoglucosamine mutase [Deltaproteobacteria bacterium]|nr:phosphoglucosamine mutase [Deltaproteobacteria bacterium]